MVTRFILLLLITAFVFSCGDDNKRKLYQDPLIYDPDPQQIGLGDYVDATISVELTDSNRNRELEADIWFPTTEWFMSTELDDSGAPYPLVVYSHGWMGTASHGAFICERLATYGIIAIAATRPDAVVPSYPDLATDVSVLIDFMLQQNEDPNSKFFGAIDPERIGSIGHSLGGYTAFANAVTDTRITALVGLAPAAGLDETDIATIDIPSLTMWGTSDNMVPAVYAKPYFDNANSPKYGVEITGGNHSGFISNPVDLEPSELDSEEQQRLTLLYSISFLRYYLNDDAEIYQYLTGDNASKFEPEVVFYSE